MPATPVLRLAILAALLGSAFTAQAQAPAAAARAETPYLSEGDAAARSARVSDVAYQLDFTLTGGKTFSATSRCRWESSASQTSAMPPEPIRYSIRYRPSTTMPSLSLIKLQFGETPRSPVEHK